MNHRILVILFLFLMNFSSAIEYQSIMPTLPEIRRAEAGLFWDNDSYFSGDDIGPTHGFGLYATALHEDQNIVFEYTVSFESFLSTFSNDVKTPSGKRIQFPRERNRWMVLGRYGRALHLNIGLGIQYTSFRPRGLEFLATAQQILFHKATESTDVENLDIGRDDELTGIARLGFGFEHTLWDVLENRLLFRSDFDFELDMVYPENSRFFCENSFLVGLTKISDGDLSILTFKATSFMETDYEDFNWSLRLALEANVPISEHWLIQLEPVVTLPMHNGISDFYNPNPDEFIYRMTVGVVCQF